MLDSVDYAGYYKIAAENGDPYAAKAIYIARAGDEAYNSKGNRLIAFVTNTFFIITAGAELENVDEAETEAIRIGLARGYANLLGNDPENMKLPTLNEIAQFHYRVLEEEASVTNNGAFGGTNLINFGDNDPIYVLPGYWCPHCVATGEDEDMWFNIGIIAF